jgi:hypothetical protein
LLGLDRFWGVGWRGLLGEEKPNPENELQHVDSIGKLLR